MEGVSFHRLAQRELFDEAIQFYDSESPGLGAAFLNEVERCTQAIQKHPEAGQPSSEPSAGGLFAVFPMPSYIPSNLTAYECSR